MKTIGLIGGMSWESSLHYYRILNEEVNKRLSGFHSAKCILFNVDFEEIESRQRSGEWEATGAILANAAQSLERAGAELLLICANTMHKVADDVQRAVSIPLVHIVDATAKEIHRKGSTTVGLLGTKYTMEQEFYVSRLRDNGLNVLIPNEDDRNTIHKIIFEELCYGKIVNPSREEYKRIINSLVAQQAEGIILGCTEIGMLIEQEDATIPLFDTTLIHAQEAVTLALG